MVQPRAIVRDGTVRWNRLTKVEGAGSWCKRLLGTRHGRVSNSSYSFSSEYTVIFAETNRMQLVKEGYLMDLEIDIMPFSIERCLAAFPGR